MRVPNTITYPFRLRLRPRLKNEANIISSRLVGDRVEQIQLGHGVIPFGQECDLAVRQSHYGAKSCRNQLGLLVVVGRWILPLEST